MRGFAILCLVAFAVADVSELAGNGYNYPQPAGSDGGLMGGDAGLSGGDGGFMGGDGGFMGGNAGDLGSASVGEPSVAGGDVGSLMGGDLGDGSLGLGGGVDDGSLGGGNLGGGSLGGSGPGRFEAEEGPSVSKRFFTVTAEDTEDADDDEDSTSSAGGHKSYDVIFANNPATSSLKSALKAVSKFAGDHETNVYVLSQQLSAKQLGAAIKASGIKPSKPNVHFVKYASPQEAALAQQRIRDQYNRLGGSSEEGGHETSPVRSVVGSAGGRRRGPSFGSQGGRYGNNGGRGGFGGNGVFGNNGGYGGYGNNAGFGGAPAGSSLGLSNRYIPPSHGGSPSGSASLGFSNRYLPPRY